MTNNIKKEILTREMIESEIFMLVLAGIKVHELIFTNKKDEKTRLAYVLYSNARKSYTLFCNEHVVLCDKKPFESGYEFFSLLDLLDKIETLNIMEKSLLQITCKDI